MNGSGYHAGMVENIMDSWGVDRHEMCQLMGISDRALYAYMKGDRRIPGPMWQLLLILDVMYEPQRDAAFVKLKDHYRYMKGETQ